MRKGLEVGEAQAIVLEATPVLGPETVVAPAALGRVLAEGVVSDRTLPPADCSAMDGFAVRASELAQASPAHPVSLPVVFEVAAGGRAPRPLAPGEAARIFTRGPPPPRPRTALPPEDTERTGERVAIRVAPRSGEHVRLAGEDVREGEEVL